MESLPKLKILCAIFLISLAQKTKAQELSDNKPIWSEYFGKTTWKKAFKKCRSIGMRLPTSLEFNKIRQSETSKAWIKETNSDSKDSYYWSIENDSKLIARSVNIDWSEYSEDFYEPVSWKNHVRCTNIKQNDSKEKLYIYLTKPTLAEDWTEDFGAMNWDDAEAKCNSIGMRLPSLAELILAKKMGFTDRWKKISDSELFWTFDTTRNTSDPYFYGITNNLIRVSLGGNYELNVRCVRISK